MLVGLGGLIVLDRAVDLGDGRGQSVDLFLDAGQQSRGSYTAGYVMLAAFGVASLLTLIFFRPRVRASREEGSAQAAGGIETSR